jgi:hypothetical protein
MGQLDSIVSVQITRETTVPTQAGFGTCLLLGTSNVIPVNTIRSYASVAEVADDFTSSDPEYGFALAFFGQALKPTTLKMAQAVPVAGAFVLKQDTAVTISVTINGATVTAASLGALATAIEALPSVASASVVASDYLLVTMNVGYPAVVTDLTAGTGDIELYQGNLSAWNFGAAFATSASLDIDGETITSATSYADLLTNILASIAVSVVDGFVSGNIIYLVNGEATPNVLTDGLVNSVATGSALNLTTHTMADILSALNDVDTDFYAVASISITEPNVLSIAGWVEANERLFATRSANVAFLAAPDVTSIGYQLSQLGYDRTFAIYHSLAASQYIDGAILGRQLPEDPGTVDWDLIRLAAVTPDALTSGQVTAIASTDSNYFRTIAGANYFRQGSVASGEWIDIIRGTDWLKARMQERVFTTLANAKKVPYTNRGIGQIEADVRAQLQDGVDVGFLASEPAFTVSVPDALTVSAADKANRILRNVTFVATYAGAIHRVEIQGTIGL